MNKTEILLRNVRQLQYLKNRIMLNLLTKDRIQEDLNTVQLIGVDWPNFNNKIYDYLINDNKDYGIKAIDCKILRLIAIDSQEDY